MVGRSLILAVGRGSLKRTSLFVFVLASCLPALSRTCFLTQIHWHINTPEGMITGVTEITWGCESTGGGSTSTGGEEPGGPGGGEPPPEEPPCQWPNSRVFVTDLHQIIDYTVMFPFGPDPTRPGGIHEGVDLMARTGTPVHAPCDGILKIGRQDIPTGYQARGSQGNVCYIQPMESFEDVGSSQVAIPGTIINVALAHLDYGWAELAGVETVQYVVKGQLIGFSDDTGSIQGMDEHLHIQYTAYCPGQADPRKAIDPQEVTDCTRN